MAKKRGHLHRYKRVSLGTRGYKVYRCIVPGCPHYISVDLVENSLCECNRCGQPMVMTKAAMQLAKPHCQDCTKSKHKETFTDIEQFLQEKLL